MKILIIAIVILVISNTITLILLIHDRRLFRKLMQRNLDKADSKSDNLIDNISYDFDNGTQQEKHLLKLLQKSLEEDKVFLNPKLTIQDLAKIIGTNKTTLSNLINNDLNQNFASLITTYRVKEAVKILNDPSTFDDKIEVIGERCGFNSRQVFHNAFKKEIGITPARFRNISRNSESKQQNQP